jgi:diketogulonate reductase-like aldo/keto reductase
LIILKRKFGWTGVEVPVIGMGTWMINGSQAIEQRALEALQLGINLGLTNIDTAEMYGNGRAEELVAEAIQGRREEVFLVSKVLPSNASYEGTLKSCKNSLKRLKTDWLDLYLLHWPGSHPIKETMRAMEKLVAEGMIKFIGVSNFNIDDLKAAEEALSNHRLACNQILYHLGYRGIESQLLPYCTKQEIAIVGYSPFGHGNFPSPEDADGQVLAKIGERHGKTMRQVALNFLTHHPNIFTIPKASRAEYVRENSGGVGWNLTEEEFKAIDRAFPVPNQNQNLETI